MKAGQKLRLQLPIGHGGAGALVQIVGPAPGSGVSATNKSSNGTTCVMFLCSPMRSGNIGPNSEPISMAAAAKHRVVGKLVKLASAPIRPTPAHKTPKLITHARPTPANAPTVARRPPDSGKAPNAA